MPTTQPKPPSTEGYDPASPTPYAPPELPQITVPETPQPKPQQPAPQVVPGQRGSKAASIAYLATSLLKGFAQGRAAADIKKTANMKRTLDGMQFAYNQAAQHYADLKKRGVTGKELDEAKAAVDSSWAAMMHIYGKYFDQGQKKSKGGKKGKPDQKGAGGVGAAGGAGGDTSSVMAGLISQDPHEKAQAYYDVAQKIGPPIYHQTSQYDTPEYKKWVETQSKIVQSDLDIENKRLRLHELERQTDLDQPGHEKEKAELERLQEDRELFPSAVGAPHYASFDTPGSSIPEGTPDAFGQPIDKTKTYRQETRGDRVSWVPASPKGTGKPIFGWSKDGQGRLYSVEIDPATNKNKAGTENYDRIPPPGMLEHVRVGEFTWKDADDNVHRAQTTTTTTPILPGSSPAKAPTSTTPKPDQKGAGAAAGAGSAKQGGFLKAGETGPLGIKQSPGDRIIGNTGAGGQAKSRATAAESVLRVLPNALDLLKDPAVQKNMGVFNGRWSEIEMKAGNLDPKTHEFWGLLKSIYAFNGSMHGWRSLKAPEEFQKAYGDLHTTPASLLGGLKAVSESAKDVYQTGFHHPWHGSKTGPLSPSGSPSPASTDVPEGPAPKTADDYLKGLQ